MAAMSCESAAATVMADISSTVNTENVPQETLGDIGKVIGKLSGTDIDYCIKKHRVVIGRNSVTEKVDVDVGLSSYVSRKHLQINYERGRFFLVCLGKNGIFIDGQFQRLGSNSIPLDQACVIRFPSTNICLSFNPNPQEGCSTNLHLPITVPHVGQPTPHSAVENEPLPRNGNVSVSLPQNQSSLFVHQSQVGVRTFPSPPFKHVAHAFLSAPPSPTGTISAVNSCPSSPKRGTFHPSCRITADLHAAASAIAASVDGKQNAKGATNPESSDAKPPYSYAQLIVQAISSAPLKQLTLSDIYAHITKNYPYYKTADKGWQNSIRHNLSLNRYFVKVPRSQEESGKGSFWKIDLQSEKKLVEQAWRKRRQRAVPCISTSLPLSDFAVIRSAPVSPNRSNPISPLSSSQGSVPFSQTDIPYPTHDAGANEGSRAVKVEARCAQSAPGSPTNHGRHVAMDTPPNVACDTSLIVPSSQQVVTSVGVVSLADNKVIWPLQPINASGTQQFTTLATSVPYEDTTQKSCASTSASQQSTAEVLPASTVTHPTSASIAVSTPSAQNQQLLQQQQQKYQQQLLMVTGRSPQIVHHAIPVNFGTLIAAPGRFVNPNVPFVVPAPVTQQYLAKRASGETTTNVGAGQAKKAKSEDNNAGGSPSKPSD